MSESRPWLHDLVDIRQTELANDLPHEIEVRAEACGAMSCSMLECTLAGILSPLLIYCSVYLADFEFHTNVAFLY